MNKNEFYKELMTRYALDHEKIRLNALKQAKKPAWQRIAADYWKPALGTAAAVAVTVAAVGYTSSLSVDPPAVVPADSALSASQRLIEAEQNYYNLQAAAASSFSDIYMTFSEPISYGEMVMAFSTVADAGEIRVETLYMESEAVLREDVLREYCAESAGEKAVIAAKISAPAALYRDIQDLPQVYLAELGSDEINDDTFTPLPIDDPDPLGNENPLEMTDVPQTSAPVTTTPFSFDRPTATASGDGDQDSQNQDSKNPVIGESGTDSATTLKPPAATSEPVPIVSEPEYVAPNQTEPEYDDPDETEPEYDDPDESEDTTAAPPDNEISSAVTEVGTSLLTELCELNVRNSLETLLSGNNAVVLTKNAAYLYTLGGFGDSRRCAAIEMNSPKISYSDAHTVILTGCNASDVRNIISVINLDTDEAKTYDVSANIGEARLGGLVYSPITNKYYVKSVRDTTSFVYEVTASFSTGLTFCPLVESDGPVSVAGVKGNFLYLLKTDQGTENSRLFSFNCTDGTIIELASFGSVAKLRRGSDLESFGMLLSDGSGFIYDVNIGMLISGISLDESTAILSDGGRTCFQSGGITYEIDPTSAVNRTWRTVEFPKEAESDFAVSEVTPEKVVVVRKDPIASWIE